MEKTLFTGNTDRERTILMVKHYQQYHKQIIVDNENGLMNASNCGWFDLDTLLEFLYDLKHNPIKEADGLRIYFGAHYEAGESIGYNTAILVGTKKGGVTGANVDLMPTSLTDKNYAFTTNEDFDNSRLCPPRCDDGETVLRDAELLLRVERESNK